VVVANDEAALVPNYSLHLQSQFPLLAGSWPAQGTGSARAPRGPSTFDRCETVC